MRAGEQEIERKREDAGSLGRVNLTFMTKTAETITQRS